MKKYFALLPVVFSLVIMLGLVSSAEPRADQTAADSYNILTLSDREVFIPCKLGYVPTEDCPDRTSIIFAVKGNKDPETGEEIETSYKVTSGRLVRKGDYFEWDLSGVEKPGYNSVTVEFVDYNGKKQKATEYITLKNCDCPNDDYLTNSLSPSPTPTAKVEKLELDRNEIFLPCPPGVRPQNEAACDDVRSIQVKTTVANPQNEELSYDYIVSGGRIVGAGANVSWDLSRMRVGTYTITVSIRDSAQRISGTQTETIRVKDCNCISGDACPALEIKAPKDSVKAGEIITFTANISGGLSEISYQWTVSQGEIIEGQGTPQIKVKTAREAAGGSLTATVELSSPQVAAICQRIASETVSIRK